MAEHDRPVNRLHPLPTRSELEQLSPEALAQAMEQTLEEMTEETYNQGVIDAYLDALDANLPAPESPDAEESYAQFQAMLSQALSTREPSGPNPRSMMRMALRVTLAAVLLLGCLMVAQAAGVDVFGAVARWTDEVFHFEVQKSHITSDWYILDEEQLESVGLDAAWVPT